MSQQTSPFDWQVVKTIFDHRAVSLFFNNNFSAVKKKEKSLKIKVFWTIY